MIKPRLFLAAMLLFLAATGVHAQQTDNLQAAREAMARYEYSKAIELLDKALEAAAGDDTAIRDLSLQKARCQKKILRYDAAAETLASVMKPGMLDVEVAGELADCHVNSGKLGDALGLYSILTMQHPDNLYFSIQKASLLFKVNDFQGCAEEGKAVCRRDSIPSMLSLSASRAVCPQQHVSSCKFSYSFVSFRKGCFPFHAGIRKRACKKWGRP